jgi:hypothetical protein
MSTTGEKEKMRVKDDCMSNLRHGDCDYITFALLVVLLLLLLLLLLLRRSFFSQPSSNPIRRTRLFLLCAHVYIVNALARVCERRKKGRLSFAFYHSTR